MIQMAGQQEELGSYVRVRVCVCICECVRALANVSTLYNTILNISLNGCFVNGNQFAKNK